MENADERPGSWWPDWDGWMKGHSSGSVQAPAKLGSDAFGVIEPAPGRYVRQKSN
jgi:polyhydroxyalkanoate synthase